MKIDDLIELEKQCRNTNNVEIQNKSVDYRQVPDGLSEIEYLVLSMLQGAYPEIIQQHCGDSNATDKFDEALWEILDGALRKLPKYQEPVLYRAELYEDISKYNIGMVIEHPYYLTATDKINVALSFEGKKFIWLIDSLQNDSVAVILPCKYLEYQVEYPRFSKFGVVGIYTIDCVCYLHVKEILQNN